MVYVQQTHLNNETPLGKDSSAQVITEEFYLHNSCHYMSHLVTMNSISW